MNREIKFRVWNDSLKIMYSPDNQIGGLWRLQESPNGILKCTQDETLMQYTGLKDINGKEIYEGDILHVIYADGREFMGDDADYIDSVYYDEHCGSFLIKRKIGADALGHDFGKSMEVIGNIFQHDYLLND